MGRTVEAEKETIFIDQVGDWGPRSGDDWFGVNEPIEATDFVKGETYEVLIKRGKPTPKFPQGKKYIAQILGQVQLTAKDVTTSPLPSSAVSEVLADVRQTAKAAADEKGVRILRQGVYQAVLHSPALTVMDFNATSEGYLALVKEVAEAVIQLIEQN